MLLAGIDFTSRPTRRKPIVVALGALLYLLDIKLDVLTELLAETFAKKGQVVILR